MKILVAIALIAGFMGFVLTITGYIDYKRKNR